MNKSELLDTLEQSSSSNDECSEDYCPLGGDHQWRYIGLAENDEPWVQCAKCGKAEEA